MAEAFRKILCDDVQLPILAIFQATVCETSLPECRFIYGIMQRMGWLDSKERLAIADGSNALQLNWKFTMGFAA